MSNLVFCPWSKQERSGRFLFVDDHNGGVWVSEQAWREFLSGAGEVTYQVLDVADAADLVASSRAFRAAHGFNTADPCTPIDQ